MQILHDRYELRTLLGRGSMGHVWQAWDSRLKRFVAIKVINPERLAGPTEDITLADIAARFTREAEITARLNHPGIPTLYDAYLHGSPKDLLLVCELVLGDNLQQILDKRTGRLTLAEALSVTAQLADILACMHTSPITHRDLKPSNIVITEDWQAKLIDFGVAALMGSDHPRLTRAGQLTGIVAYMAPEQFHEHTLVTPQIDLYALGCMTYQMLTGQLPFPGDLATMMDGHRNRRPTPIQELCPDLPRAIADLLMAMLAKKITERPATARDIADQLSDYRTPPTTPDTFTEPQAAPGTARAEAAAAPQPRKIRLVQAHALFDDGRFGDARPLYLELSAELDHPDTEHADEAAACRAHAAYCAMSLGNLPQALLEYQMLATDLEQSGAADGLLLEVRLHVGLLQEQTAQIQAAVETLSDIYSLLVEAKGRDARESQDARAALNRLHAAARATDPS
ncbi:protein kinase domain-containing protein [Streptomyces sp. NPDC002523]